MYWLGGQLTALCMFSSILEAPSPSADVAHLTCSRPLSALDQALCVYATRLTSRTAKTAVNCMSLFITPSRCLGSVHSISSSAVRTLHFMLYLRRCRAQRHSPLLLQTHTQRQARAALHCDRNGVHQVSANLARLPPRAVLLS